MASHTPRAEAPASRGAGNLQAPSDLDRRTFDAFGYQWSAFGDLDDEQALYWERYSAGLPQAELSGKVGLDAGCGSGRYSVFLAPRLGQLVALDASDAAYTAARNLAPVPNAAVVRADLRSAPFADGTFDFVSSLGVLHHLEDPEAGFRKLVGLLRPGGIVFLYVYSRAATGSTIRHLGIVTARALRVVTVKLPRPVLRILSYPIAVALRLLFVVPGEFGVRHGIRRLARLPLYTYRGRSLRSIWLDTFDRLSAPIEHRFLWEELAGWFERAGVEVVSARDDTGWYVVGRKGSRATP